MKTLNDYIIIYKEQLEKEDIQKAYIGLLKYVMELNTHFTKTVSDKFSVGNISPGYMDFTYFPFFNEYLRNEKLRFGIILNHKKLRFELWLMGQNQTIQNRYWNLLRTSKWNKDLITKPKYSFLEVILIENPDFNDLNSLTKNLEDKTISLSQEIIEYIKQANQH
ncbi:MAG: DUF7000 family protein [Dysgonomonas sp.]